MKKILLTVSSAVLLTSAAWADVVYVTANTSNCVSTVDCGNGPNQDLNPSTGAPIYTDNSLGAFTGAISAVPGKPPTPGARYFSNGFSNSTPDLGITLSPTLGVPGGIYKLYHVFSSAAGNVSTDIVLGATNVSGCDLSFTSTDKFQSQYGVAVSGANVWQLLGFVTNSPAQTNPVITFYFQGGIVSAGAAKRLVVDTFRFSLYEPCTDVPTVGVTGPLAANLASVVVTGVSNAATKISVYQDSGAGMVAIGELTTGIVAGNNSVPVTGLIKNAQVAATQTLNGQEGCLPTSGVLVGGGANPRVRVVLSIRETTSTGPVGAAGSTSSGNLHFLGASFRNGSAPGDGPVITPGNNWQTVMFDRGTVQLGNASNAVGTVTGDPGYAPDETVAIRVYAYQTYPGNGVQIFSPVPAQSSVVTSNATFSVNWSWDAVPGADGYRLLRSYNSDDYTNSSTDVVTTTFLDSNSQWGALAPVTPSLTQTNASIKWNAAAGSDPVGTLNALPGQWGVIDAIAFAIDDLTDTGPYDLYIDNLQNGSTIFQTFENAVGNTSGYGFRAPGFSGSTSGNLLGAPSSAVVSVRAADTGTKALHVKFQWNGTNNTKWLRFTTSGVGNPQVNLNDPTSIRFLLLPVGASAPVQPAAPALSIGKNGAGETVLDWTGGHNLQSATAVTGTYTNTGVTLGPWTNSLPDPETYFRLADPYDD